jgi:hypothetical protein
MKTMSRLLPSAVVLAALAACGGGSDVLNIGGVWKGTWQPVSPFTDEPFQGVVEDGGPAFFYDHDGFLFVVPPIVGGKLDSTSTLYPPYGFVFTGGDVSLPAGIKGDVSSGQMSGKVFVNGAFANFQLKPTTPTTGQVDIVAGTWSGNYIGGAIPSNVAWTVSAAGDVIGHDAYGCTITGKLTLLDAGKDLFSVAVHSTGASQICAGSMTGLAYKSSHDDLDLFGHAAGTYYYVTAHSDKGAFVAEFQAQ